MLTDVRDPSESRCSREGLPAALSTDLSIQSGPRLYEQTDYAVYARSRVGKAVELRHRDPTLCPRWTVKTGH
jgi:hypothetical protein